MRDSQIKNVKSTIIKRILKDKQAEIEKSTKQFAKASQDEQKNINKSTHKVTVFQTTNLAENQDANYVYIKDKKNKRDISWQDYKHI